MSRPRNREIGRAISRDVSQAINRAVSRAIRASFSWATLVRCLCTLVHSRARALFCKEFQMVKHDAGVVKRTFSSARNTLKLTYRHLQFHFRGPYPGIPVGKRRWKLRCYGFNFKISWKFASLVRPHNCIQTTRLGPLNTYSGHEDKTQHVFKVAKLTRPTIHWIFWPVSMSIK